MTGNVRGKKVKPRRPEDPKPAPRPSQHPISAPSHIAPGKGPAGALVNITAKKDLTETTGVWFGNKKAEITARAPPTSLQVKAPEGGRDKVKIRVSTRRGDFELGEFAYEQPKK